MLASVIFMFSPDWKKKDEEHAEWDKRRRSSLEQVREGVGRMRLCKFAFTLYHPYLVCLLFGMPSLHLVTFLKFSEPAVLTYEHLGMWLCSFYI